MLTLHRSLSRVNLPASNVSAITGPCDAVKRTIKPINVEFITVTQREKNFRVKRIPKNSIGECGDWSIQGSEIIESRDPSNKRGESGQLHSIRPRDTVYRASINSYDVDLRYAFITRHFSTALRSLRVHAQCELHRLRAKVSRNEATRIYPMVLVSRSKLRKIAGSKSY